MFIRINPTKMGPESSYLTHGYLYRLATSMMTYGVIEPVLDEGRRVQHKEGWYGLCAVPIWLLDNRIRSSRI